MDTKRYLGIDLHRDCFTCCIRLETGRTYLSRWKLEELGKFVGKLRPGDEVAVEVTSNTRLFYQAVAPHVARVVVVDAHQFRVIAHSVKKTDPNDARNLALYLEKDLLPEVRMKDPPAQAIVNSYNYSVEMEERVANRFNEAVRDYKERTAAAEC